MESSGNWRKNARCKDLDPELFFPPAGNQLMNEAAKNICRQCPVINECFEDSYARKEGYGVWGGVGEDERKDLLDKQRRNEAKNCKSLAMPQTAGQIAVGV